MTRDALDLLEEETTAEDLRDWCREAFADSYEMAGAARPEEGDRLRDEATERGARVDLVLAALSAVEARGRRAGREELAAELVAEARAARYGEAEAVDGGGRPLREHAALVARLGRADLRAVGDELRQCVLPAVVSLEGGRGVRTAVRALRRISALAEAIMRADSPGEVRS